MRVLAEIQTKRFIPPCEGPTISEGDLSIKRMIHPPCEGPTKLWNLIPKKSVIHPPMRGADRGVCIIVGTRVDSSPPCEGPTKTLHGHFVMAVIHPPMRGADTQCLYRFECSSHCRCAICTISQCVYLIYYLLDEKNGPVRLILSQSHPAPSAPLLP